MARPNKKQHKVPKSYMEPFTDKNGLVWVADKNLRLYQEKPKNILTENDYYTVRFPSGGGTLAIETKFLGGIEASYAAIYKNKISKHELLSDEERAIVAIFIASMLERSPRRREAIQDMFDQVKNITEKMRASVAAMTPEQRKVFESQSKLIGGNPDNSIPADEFLKAGEDVGSFHSSGIPESVAVTAPLIYEMKWAFLIRPKESEPFITSDSPCTFDIPTLPPKSIFGGLGHKDVEVSMAMSPDIAILCGYQMEQDWGYMPAKESEVQEINRRIRRRSETLVSNDKLLLERQIERIKSLINQKP